MGSSCGCTNSDQNPSNLLNDGVAPALQFKKSEINERLALEDEITADLLAREIEVRS